MSYQVTIAGIPFERDEIWQLMLAILALIAAFTWPTLTRLPLAIVVALLAFFLHEYGHKVVAYAYGYTTRFRAHPLGIFLLVLSSLITQGFPVGYAGYIEVLEKRVEKDQVANIALAGPLVNFLTGLLLAAVNDVVVSTSSLPASLLYLPGFLFLKVASLTCIGIGIFNLLPKAPLDGEKIFSYSRQLWSISVGLGIAAFCVVIWI